LNKARGAPMIFFKFFGPKLFVGFLCFDDWIWLKDSKKCYNRCLLLNLQNLNGLGEGTVYNRRVRGKTVKFYISLFGAINWRNEPPTTVNSIFSSYKTILIMKRWKLNKKNDWKIEKKARGTPWIFLNFFWLKFFLWDLHVPTVGSDWGKLKKVWTDVCCSIRRF